MIKRNPRDDTNIECRIIQTTGSGFSGGGNGHRVYAGIDTDMTQTLDEAARAKRLAPVPLSRFGSPAEVAALIVFPASDASAYMTGQVVGVDGGLHM